MVEHPRRHRASDGLARNTRTFLHQPAFRTGLKSTHKMPELTPPAAFPYATHLNVLYPPRETIAIDPLVAAVRDSWYNQTLVRVNESVVRLGVMQGEYHWHEHTEDDEFFFVLEGSFLIDLEPRADGVTPGRVVTLGPREGFVVPKGVRHRTRAPERAVILMVETSGIVPTGS
jgi:mannose-6-phosphate isomerase-like protein (cupin superfamily)